MLPFSTEQFVSVFVTYNQAIWPMQVITYGLGLAAFISLVQPGAAASRLACFVLAALWLWTGIFYHGLHFSQINVAATGFAVAFVIEGLLFAYEGLRNRLVFEPQRNVAAWTGYFLVVYALAVYPLINLLTAHPYPEMPTFGVTPCPLALFTLGFLLLARSRVSWGIWIVPLLWSLIGGSAAFLLNVPSDWLLLLAGIGMFAFAIAGRMTRRSSSRTP